MHTSFTRTYQRGGIAGFMERFGSVISHGEVWRTPTHSSRRFYRIPAHYAAKEGSKRALEVTEAIEAQRRVLKLYQFVA